MSKVYVRKLGKIGRAKTPSYYLTIPRELVHELDWRKGENIAVRRRGQQLVIEPLGELEARNDR